MPGTITVTDFFVSQVSTSQTTPLESDIDIEQNEDLITEAMKQEEEELAKAAEEEETNALAKVCMVFQKSIAFTIILTYFILY
jgi:hypothetical protein